MWMVRDRSAHQSETTPQLGILLRRHLGEGGEHLNRSPRCRDAQHLHLITHIAKAVHRPTWYVSDRTRAHPANLIVADRHLKLSFEHQEDLIPRMMVRRRTRPLRAALFDQCPVPQGDPSARALPQRAGRAQVSLHGHATTRPERHRPGAMDEPLEAGAQRLRDHLRRPPLLRLYDPQHQ
jgi:hypothetical protein